MLRERLGGEPDPQPGEQSSSPPPPDERSDQQGDQPSPPPPWGDDFDAQRAWNTIQRQRETERDLRTQLQARDRERMTETERAQAERDQFRQERDEAQLELMRYRVGALKGLPANAVKYLNGSTQEELELAADELKLLIGDKPPAPVPDFGAGARPNGGTTDEADFNALLRRSAGRPA